VPGRRVARESRCFTAAYRLGSDRVGVKKLSDGDYHTGAIQAARGYLEASELGGPDEEDNLRTLPVATPFFKRYNHRQAVFHLDHKPELLGAGGTSLRAWQSYQSYLGRVRVVARADFYKRLMARHGCKTVRALARITGEDWSRICRILKILELPAPVLDYLRTHDSPALVRCFSEKRLHELRGLGDPDKIWNRFRSMLKEISQEVQGN
jgi:hypothetical protein